MKRIFSSHNGLFIDYVQRLLEEEGIPCMQRNQYLSGGVGELPPNECWPELWITNDADLTRARACVDSAVTDVETPAKDWICPVCGEHIEGQFGSCWHCNFNSDSVGN